MNKAIVKLYPRGYCVAIIYNDSVMRASSFMIRAEAEQVLEGSRDNYLVTQAQQYRHFISTKDVERGIVTCKI